LILSDPHRITDEVEQRSRALYARVFPPRR
jgi:hypothetical protein